MLALLVLSSTTVIDAGTADGAVATDVEAYDDRGVAFFFWQTCL